MTKRNTANELIKLRYFEQMKHVDGKAKSTIAQHENSIAKLETFTGFKSFKTFDQKQAIDFKDELQKSGRSLSTVSSTINQIIRFLSWLRMERGYTRSIKASDIQYLNLSEKDKRAAAAPSDKKYPSLQLIERVVASMPSETAIEKRDRALVAFIAITGIRDGAAISLKLRHFDTKEKLVIQNPREVTTKANKRIDTYLFDLNDVFEPIVLGWVEYLRNELAYCDHDPLFPKTALAQDEDFCFAVNGLSRDHWASASPIRTILKQAFSAIGEISSGPHSFRHMIVSEMYRRGLSVQEFKAWSQNLGHEGAMTTLTSYGKIEVEEQGRLVRNGAAQALAEAPLTQSQLEEILSARGL